MKAMGLVILLMIPGMKSIKQVSDNIGSIGWEMTDEERNRINEVCALFN